MKTQQKKKKKEFQGENFSLTLTSAGQEENWDCLAKVHIRDKKYVIYLLLVCLLNLLSAGTKQI